jgi:putative transposon-encoded protein
VGLINKKNTNLESDIPLNVLSPMNDNKVITNKVKFEVYGEEMLEKEVKLSGNSGRVYLPPEWIGKHVKIIRIS